jgi:S1-C subfamily serine protease
MKFHLTVLTGSRTGLSRDFDQPFVGLGRHPESDLQLHPEQDLDVSSRHAALLTQGTEVVVRDLESANGTWVNGRRIIGDRTLHSGDVVGLGAKGPQIQFVVEGVKSRSSISAETAAEGPRTGSATQRIRAEVARQTKMMRQTTFILFGCFLLVAAGYFVQKAAYERRLDAERAAMIRQMDSLTTALNSTNFRIAGLRAQADSAQQEAAALRQRIQDGGDPQQIETYRRELAAALARQKAITSAATLDPHLVDSLDGNAVGLVIVRFADDSVFTGTGFVVGSDANGAWLLTNRHVVRRENGMVASELGVVFNHSNQQFRGEVLKIHDGVDLALIHVAVKGGVDKVRSLDFGGASVGQPVATIGFPLGLDLAGGESWQKEGVAATVGAATVSRTLPNLIQLDGYGATGASGSPILDRNGNVVAVLFGGERESNGRIVYSVPVRFALDLIRGVVPGY